MSDIEFTVPTYHPEGCSCELCLAVGDMMAENERLRIDFTTADAAVKNQRETVQRWQAEVVTLRARVQELEKAQEILVPKLLDRIVELEGALAVLAEANLDYRKIAIAPLRENNA